MNNKMDNNFLLLLIVISVAIGEIALICYNPFIYKPKWMEPKELTVTQMTFGLGNGNGTITVALTNSGTSDVTVSLVKVNGNTIDLDDWRMNAAPIPAGETATLTINNQTIASGNKYAVTIFTPDGSLVDSYQDTT